MMQYAFIHRIRAPPILTTSISKQLPTTPDQ